MKKIIAATDFSEHSSNAATYAVEMAREINADIVLLHVCPAPMSFSEVPVIFELEEQVVSASKKLLELKKQLSIMGGPSVNIETEVRSGMFFQQLSEFCDHVKPYVVILGSQGTTVAEKVMMGSHSVYASKHLNWPLITVPPNARFRSVLRIGIACDLEKVVETIPLDEIKKLVNDFHAELHIINAGKNNVFDPATIFQSGLLQEMLIGLQPVYHFITTDNTDEGIIDFVDKLRLDLLVVLPKRHSLVEKLSRRSHSKQIILHSHVPVLTLHE